MPFPRHGREGRKGAIMKARLVLLVLFAGAAVAAEPPQPKLLTPELVEDLAQVSDVAIRPDGTEVLYRLRVPRKEDEEPGPARFELRVVPSRGGPSRLLVPAHSDPSQPAWSPDGRWVSFVSSRRTDEPKDEEPKGRLFLLPTDGGEARAISPRGYEVQNYCWRPDGGAVAVVLTDPEPPERKEASKKGKDWTVVDRDVPARRLWIVDVATGDSKPVTEKDLVVWEVDWVADGSLLVAAVTDAPARVDDEYIRKRLVVVDGSGAAPARLLLPARGKLERPRVSPDGEFVAFLGALDPHDPSAGTLHVVPVGGGTARAIAPDSAVNFRSFAWLPGGRIAAVGEEGVRTLLALVSVREGRLDRLLEGDLVMLDVSVSKDGTRYAFAASRREHPAEAFVGRIGAKEPPARLTTSNPILETISLARQKRISWTARDGTTIEGVVLEPVGFEAGRRYPLLVTPHGGPEFASLDGWNAGYLYLGQVAAAQGWLVLLPNYRGSTGRGEPFARANHGDLGGAEFDDVLDGIASLVNQGIADPDRVAIAGGSYGGYFAAWGATKHTDSFAAAVVFAGISNWTSMSGTSDIPEENTRVHWGFESYLDRLPLLLERSPIAYAASARTPTLILHGEKDRRVPVGQAYELYTALRLRGVPVELVVYPRAGHGLSERAQRLDAARRILDWLDRYGMKKQKRQEEK
jgi:dipeptidyl aminopeptidase/acylaminoacyl peptidase